jgi:hypothetical protein
VQYLDGDEACLFMAKDSVGDLAHPSERMHGDWAQNDEASTSPSS